MLIISMIATPGPITSNEALIGGILGGLFITVTVAAIGGILAYRKKKLQANKMILIREFLLANLSLRIMHIINRGNDWCVYMLIQIYTAEGEK